jgi:hypothetical protein
MARAEREEERDGDDQDFLDDVQEEIPEDETS